jgi:hypothetical protein
MGKELAEHIVSESMIQTSLESAMAYPELKILCLFCFKGMFGSELPEHIKNHLKDAEPPPDHWEAL